MAERLEVGDGYGLRFCIDWSALDNPQTGADATRGEARLWIANDLLWGKREDRTEGGIEWTWIELLEFLAQAWVYLEWEEGFPLGLEPSSPATLHEAAEVRWQEHTAERVAEEARELYAFQENHDLARALQGAVAPPVWLLREGNLMWIASSQRAVLRPAQEVLTQLEALGEALCRRLEGIEDARVQGAVDDWLRRRERPLEELAEISVRLPAETLRQLVPEHEWTDPTGRFHVTELLAAARCMGDSLKPADCRKTLQAIADTPPLPTPDLDALSREACALLADRPDRKPYDGGYALAAWFRAKIGSSADEAIEPRRVLTRLGVEVREIRLESEHLDAVACWGPRHGPAVILNTAGKHAQSPAGRNATLAHELAHLLVDRAGALPLVEVFNGRGPRHVEARAGAFAAELLLPRKQAFAAAQDAPDITTALRILNERFAVSQELAAWQIRNSGALLRPDQVSTLRSLVSEPQRF